MKKAQKRLIPGVPHPLEASKLKYSIKGRFEPFPWPKVNQNAVKRLSYYIFMIHLCQRCLLGAILGHLGVILGPKMVKFWMDWMDLK